MADIKKVAVPNSSKTAWETHNLKDGSLDFIRASKNANLVLASPSGSNGVPSFRALTSADIPTITKSKISDMPTKLSQFSNDSGFVTSASVPTKVSQLTNDSGFVTSASVPTKVSQLTNDSGFASISQDQWNNTAGWTQPINTVGTNVQIGETLTKPAGKTYGIVFVTIMVGATTSGNYVRLYCGNDNREFYLADATRHYVGGSFHTSGNVTLNLRLMAPSGTTATVTSAQIVVFWF